MKAKRVPYKKAIEQCAWCGKKIKANQPVYGFGGRKRTGMDLTEYEGSAILLPMATIPKEVICTVTSAGSQARADGKDFMFMVCSEDCANEMKSVMKEEMALGDAVLGSLEEMRN